MRKNHNFNTPASLAARLKGLDDRVSNKSNIRIHNNKHILELLLRCNQDLQNLTLSLIKEKSTWSITDIKLDGYIGSVIDGYVPTLSFIININPDVSIGTQFNGAIISSCRFLIQARKEHGLNINCDISSIEVKLLMLDNSFSNALTNYISKMFTTNLTLL